MQRKKSLRLLSYGCGTGGDVAGLTAALGKSGILNGGTLDICGVEGNGDALSKCRAIFTELERYWNFPVRITFRGIQHRVEGCDFTRGLPLESGSFDIIESSKMINELLEDNWGAYYQFLRSMVPRYLCVEGLVWLADVPVMRRTSKQSHIEDILEPPVPEWSSKLMSDAVKAFTKNSAGAYSIILPVPCAGCRETGCYSSVIYSYRFFSGDAPLVRSPLTCRLIASSDLAKELCGNAVPDKVFVTCYRKDGSRDGCCMGRGTSKKIRQAAKASDGYRFFYGQA